MSYIPFKMAAVGGSPIEKNFGTSEQRGFPLKSFGTKDTEFLDKEGTDTSTGLNYGAAVGSSPNKESLVRAPAPQEVAPADAAPALEVPPHGDESHTGGAVGGGEESPWEVMKSGAFGDMKKGARKDYMAGLDKDQRRQQIKSNFKGGMGLSSFGGAFGSGGGGGMFGGMFSDIRLKENIERTGVSESGIPMYEFNYIGDESRYSGAMAQDVLETNPDAVSTHESGYYMVDYDSIDINMELI